MQCLLSFQDLRLVPTTHSISCVCKPAHHRAAAALSEAQAAPPLPITTVVLLPLIMAVELGEVDLYAYLLGGAALSCLIAVQWWTPWALLLLCCWYLRYAGLRPTACAGPPSAPPAARAANAPAVLGRPQLQAGRQVGALVQPLPHRL